MHEFSSDKESLGVVFRVLLVSDGDNLIKVFNCFWIEGHDFLEEHKLNLKKGGLPTGDFGPVVGLIVWGKDGLSAEDFAMSELCEVDWVLVVFEEGNIALLDDVDELQWLVLLEEQVVECHFYFEEIVVVFAHFLVSQEYGLFYQLDCELHLDPLNCHQAALVVLFG